MQDSEENLDVIPFLMLFSVVSTSTTYGSERSGWESSVLASEGSEQLHYHLKRLVLPLLVDHF